jgi:hypothetical protein
VEAKSGGCVTEVQIRGLLMSVSVTFSNKARGLHSEDKKGAAIVPLFLDTLLMDSCTPEVRECFVEAFSEQLAKMNSGATKP